jgi:hypothetical protein
MGQQQRAVFRIRLSCQLPESGEWEYMPYSASVRELVWFAHTMLLQTVRQRCGCSNGSVDVPSMASVRNEIHVLNDYGSVEYFEDELEEQTESSP